MIYDQISLNSFSNFVTQKILLKYSHKLCRNYHCMKILIHYFIFHSVLWWTITETHSSRLIVYCYNCSSMFKCAAVFNFPEVFFFYFEHLIYTKKRIVTFKSFLVHMIANAIFKNLQTTDVLLCTIWNATLCT